MSALKQELHTPQQYLEMERRAERKSEYINGCIYAMSGASREHNLITVNLTREISARLRGQPCEVYTNDMRVQVSETGLYTYPDVVVVCGEPQFEDAHFDTLLNPTVLIEVLSPSTASYDHNEKAAHYHRLASLRDYVMIAQNRMRVEHHTRRDEGWLFTERDAPDDVLHLASIGCDLTLRDIYEKVQFPEQPAGRAPLPPGAPLPQSNGTIPLEEDA